MTRNGSLKSLARGRARVERVTGLEDADLEQLPRVVPLVHRVVDVEALVALQANQLGVERRREGLRDLRLADAGLALEEKRALQPQREKCRHRQRAVGDVRLRGERRLQIVDRRGPRGRRPRWRLRTRRRHQPARSIARTMARAT